MAKSSLEKALEKYQKEAAKNIKQKIQADKRLADKQRREAERRSRIEMRIERATSIVNGQPVIEGVRIIDKSSQILVEKICDGYRRTDYKVSSRDVQIPEYLERDLELEFEKLKQYGLISQYFYYIDGCWEISILPSMFTYLQDKEEAMSKAQKTNNFTNNFYGDVSDVQIQQGTTNSIQTKNVNSGLDYELVGKIIEQIKKYDGMIDDEFGTNAAELREKVDEISFLVKKQEKPDRIKSLLCDIKNLAIGVGGSLIASGIVNLLQGIV